MSYYYLLYQQREFINKENTITLHPIQVEDGRLYYDKKWYGRYQNVFVECREFGKIPAVIQSICSRFVLCGTYQL